MEIHFWSKYFVLFVKWKRSLCHRVKLCTKKASCFSMSYSMKNKIGHGEKVLEFCWPIPV